MSAHQAELDPCGCCEGSAPLTPASLANPPRQPALAYRAGVHGAFKAAMLAGLARQPALQDFTARAADDPAIALIDAWAMALDVLTFYQERIANEGYLRTATERRSILELARAIGYELRPAVAAGTVLAFELETTPSAPEETTIPVGAKAQSVPGPGEKPQTFETVEALTARRAWGQLRPRRAVTALPRHGDTRIYLQGTATNLKPGDALLIVGDERLNDPASERWDMRRVSAVKAVAGSDGASGYTVVDLDRGLGSTTPYVAPAQQNPRVYALRLRANLFGNNAPDWRAMPVSVKASYLGVPEDSVDPSLTEWPDFTMAGISDPPAGPSARLHPQDIHDVHLDAIYPNLVAGSWAVLSVPEYQEIYRVESVAEDARTNFAISAKSTRLALRGENLREIFNQRVRETVVFGQSEELLLAARPLVDPVHGRRIVLDRLMPDLPAGRLVVVTGKRMRARAAAPVTLTAPDGATRNIAAGDVVVVAAAPLPLPGGRQRWTLTDKYGFTGSADAGAGLFELMAADNADPAISEAATIKSVLPASDPTCVELTAPLAHWYDRATVAINANVARATHGETRREVLGSGDAGQAFQRFDLKQAPLTYVGADTPSGAASTLEVRVNTIAWQETGSFYGHGPRDRVFVTRLADDGKSTVQFGDGVHGARLAPGAENVTAVYRSGGGVEGMVKPGQLSLLLTRPLGVKGVTNPLAPTGADDAETRDEARANAPNTVLAFDRIVSLADFEHFAGAFGGIAKAQASALWRQGQQTVVLTVAGAHGAAVPPGDPLQARLRSAIRKAGAALTPFDILSYERVIFALRAEIIVAAGYLAEQTLKGVRAALEERFSFARRTLGQSMDRSEAIAVIQAVAGVATVNVTSFHIAGPGRPATLADRLAAYPGRRTAGGSILPAQLVIVDPALIELVNVTVFGK